MEQIAGLFLCWNLELRPTTIQATPQPSDTQVAFFYTSPLTVEVLYIKVRLLNLILFQRVH
jgi:hypothetical protein